MSGSKLTSPTPANELVSSLERLGGDSPVTEICDIGERGVRHSPPGETGASPAAQKPHSDASPSLRGGSQTIVTDNRYETR